MAPCKEEKKFLLELIDMYRSLPALWQIKSKEYSDRQTKDSAYETLLHKYREYYKEGTKDELKKKLNALRTNFRKELKKINDSQKSGAGTAEVYESSQWCFNALLFLVDQETPAPSTSTIQLSQRDTTQEVSDLSF
ncbi:hypothetical protein PoB_007666200 [Plakobranchus ocellatus]|uniref:MADF domain-containing protein n=1 Tax=Plakobranchus ocellatus TaxID=259542 RepID=A0AAV4E0P9_9GAST|nr:hypothetical protein PoB_007666200 [Plakobranchus ocellatus]